MYVLIVATLVVATTAENLLFVPRSSTTVVCPDKKHACPTGNYTCCILADQSYGCCPLPNAVCCIDRKYCCPAGSKCLSGKPGSCVRGSQVFPSLRKTRAKVIIKKRKKISITDNISVKSDANRIVKDMDWFKKGPSVSSVMCPDGQSECMDGQTCCPMDGGTYGCCPIADANCCSDHVHCCPPEFKCDILKQECVGKRGLRIRWINTIPPHKSSTSIRKGLPSHMDIKCLDGHSECKSGQTCCKLASGDYGCCPIPKAVCCSDGKHCCPQGTTCDLSSGKCNHGDLAVVDWVEKVPAIITDVVCPDGQSKCQTGQTCCKLATGDYGCCPIPKAVCCTDGKHCCPEGTTCDLSSGKCNRGDLAVVDWVEKVPAIITDVTCPDGQSKCKTGQTCCKLATGNYGCCPMPKAVCCMDNIHCCPANTTCNLKNSSCDSQLRSQPMVSKVAAVKLPTVICPDGKSECPDSYGCCIKTNSTGYSCCPYKNGVCCTNSNFCCPKTYVCDEEPGICRIPYTYGFVNMSRKTIRVKPLY